MTVDPEAAAGYLAEKLGDPAGLTLTKITELTGGWSRRTYVADLAARGGEASRRIVVRVKPPSGLLATDIRTEYEVMRAAHDTGLAVPRPLWLDEDADVFVGPSFACDWVAGTAPNTWRARDRVALEADWKAGGNLAEQFVRSLVGVHAVPRSAVTALGPALTLADLAAKWRAIYEDVRIAPDPVIEEGLACIEESAPRAREEPTLVHGDFRIGNMLLDDGRITAILDWELAFVGDPHFDLGYCALEYLAGRMFRPASPLVCAMCDREWLYSRYEELSGRTVDRELVRAYTALSAIVLTVILLTGVRAHHDGRSADVRLAWGRFAVAGLRQSLTEILGWSDLAAAGSGRSHVQHDGRTR
ncbi:phosphotransferase family protein [Baekduia soli]|uniref:phosphotransferase family protein n=1 Tax=Baekduia soli TaxID=496014 RepID=UPI001651F3EA|nr:phosphotransferase family protein [Baekduia soli]